MTKEAKAAYYREYYKKNRRQEINRIHSTYNERKLFIRRFKDKPCTDCGKCYPHYVMDFDHIKGVKFAGLSKMHLWCEKRILEEMAKCELVCANCHRIRTWGKSPQI